MGSSEVSPAGISAQHRSMARSDEIRVCNLLCPIPNVIAFLPSLMPAGNAGQFLRSFSICE
jgi:hypothetical protein